MTEHSVIIPLTRRTEEIFGGLYAQQHMHNFNRSGQHHRHDDQTPDIARAQNLALQNVLSWSLAKNVPEAELPQFERVDQSKILPPSPYRLSKNLLKARRQARGETKMGTWGKRGVGESR